MAQLMQPFNARDYDPTQGGTGGFPIGKHRVVNRKSEVKPTKDGNSGMVVFEAEIIDGEFKGTVGAVRFNLYSTSQQAAEIAHKQFSALCHVVGVMNVSGTEALHDKPYMIEVALQAGDNPKKYTEVKKFFDINGNEPVPGQMPNQGGGQQQQQNTGFGNNQNNGQQQQNNGGFGQQQNNAGFGQANNVSMPDQQQNQGQGGFGQQSNANGGGFGQQAQQQVQNNGGNQNWQPNQGGMGNNSTSGGAGNGGGGWGQQRS